MILMNKLLKKKEHNNLSNNDRIREKEVRQNNYINKMKEESVI